LENTALKNSRSDASAKLAGPRLSKAGFVQAWTHFWFQPVSPLGLSALRVFSGVLFIFWLLTLAGQQDALFGLTGWVDKEAYGDARRFVEAAERDRNPENPEINEEARRIDDDFQGRWSVLFMFGASAGWLTAVYWLTLAVFGLFTLGLWTRLTSVLTWLMVVSFTANPVTRHDADPLLGMLAFYLMIGYVLQGQWRANLSWPERILGSKQTWLFSREEQPPSIAANLAVRLLQVHFALVVVASGLYKLQIGDWWAGVAFWYPLHPPFQTTLENLRGEAAHARSTLFFLSLAQYVLLAWQFGFPFFAWRKSGRVVLLGGALIGWIGCLAIYKQPLFGPIYCICALSYLTPEEWSAIFGKLKPVAERTLGRKSFAAPAPARQGSKA
jgi:hypothetical protein